MINRFYRNETIGDGELTKLDVLKRYKMLKLWYIIIFPQYLCLR